VWSGWIHARTDTEDDCRPTRPGPNLPNPLNQSDRDEGVDMEPNRVRVDPQSLCQITHHQWSR